MYFVDNFYYPRIFYCEHIQEFFIMNINMSGQCQELKKWKSQNFDEDFMEHEVSDHSRGPYGELQGEALRE